MIDHSGLSLAEPEADESIQLDVPAKLDDVENPDLGMMLVQPEQTKSVTVTAASLPSADRAWACHAEGASE